MAKAKKAPTALYEKEGVVLVPSPSFTYEVQKFVNYKNRYNLDNTTLYRSEEPLRILEVYAKDKLSREIYTLVGAPLKWLVDNKFKLCET